MTRIEFEGILVSKIVDNNWDIPSGHSTASEATLKPKRSAYFGPDVTTCEEMKRVGWGLTSNSSASEIMIGYGLIAYAHYYRSLEAAINSRHRHPDFSEYMTHWLHSDKSFVPQNVFQALEGMYPAPKKLQIRPGKSYWDVRV